MKKIALVSALLALAGVAQAGEYACKVYCLSPSGNTTVVVNAGSADQAAQIVDKQSDKICQNAGYGKSTSSTMSASQCRPN